MTSNLDVLKIDLEKLIKKGANMGQDLEYRHRASSGELDEEAKQHAKSIANAFERDYQEWFTESSAVICQLIPDRLSEFVELYRGSGKRKAIGLESYHIQDWLNGIMPSQNSSGAKSFDGFGAVTMRFQTQRAILGSASMRFESSLMDLRQLVQADLFDSEIDAARELLKCGFRRGAGAISGVVLEKHLSQVAVNHNIKTRKKNPTISDLNEMLKAEEVLDIPNWRQIQRLGDIRNLCDHNKERAPTGDEIQELINGVEKFTKTLF